MEKSSTTSQDASEGEIDLIELIHTLWAQKLLIFLTILVVMSGAIAYAFLSKPVYEAKLYLQPPTFNGIAEFNYGRTRDAELDPFSVKDVYDVFVRNLQSESLRRTFFDEVYLPSVGESQRSGSRDALYADFQKDLTVGLASKISPDRYVVTVQSSDPAQATEWAQGYASRAGAAAEKEMIRNVTREAEVRARNLEQQIIALQENSKKTQNDSIVQLREALRIAESIGLENPPIISGNLSAEVSASMDGQLTYMRGTKALKAEIQNLEARQSNDPFIENLRSLQIKQGFYRDLHIDPEAVAVYRQDGGIQQPDRPIKPKKALILVLGLILGGMLGIFIALINHFIRNHTQKQTQIM